MFELSRFDCISSKSDYSLDIQVLSYIITQNKSTVFTLEFGQKFLNKQYISF